MKRTLMLVVVSMFLLHAWMRAEKRVGTLDMSLVTSFDFSSYPACSVSRSSYCILAIRFYDADSNTRLAEVFAPAGAAGPQSIVAPVRVSSIPRHVYAVSVYQDGHKNLKEGRPGKVSAFHDAEQ